MTSLHLAARAERLRRVRLVGRLGAVAFGLLHTWLYLHDIRDVDGVSYLDLGDALLRADWETALNAYWSPLYAALLGVVVAAIRPPPAWEYPLTQAVNFAVYLWALACFEWLLRTLLEPRRDGGHATEDHERAIPGWALFALGYALFVWSALYWHFFWLQAPDLLVAGFVFAAGALLLRIHRGAPGRGTFVALGLVLGLAYLAKAAMFPLGLVFLGSAVLAARRQPSGLVRVAGAAAVFLVVVAPWAAALSASKGRLTFGDSGRLNYAWYVNGGNQVAHWPHWQGRAGHGTPSHPSRRILDEPAIYEFGTPVGGTYPMWYDPSYWHAGLEPRFELRAQVRRLIASAAFYRGFFNYGPQPGLFVALAALYAGGPAGRRTSDLLHFWPLYLPAAAALALYSLVYLEARYIAPFVLLLWFGALAGGRLPRRDGAQRVAAGAALGAALLVAGQLVWASALDLSGRGSVRDFDGRVHARVAEAMWSLGVEPGSRIGVIGSGLNAARWARLARLRIVAELPRPSRSGFWQADLAVEHQVVERFCSTGASGVVAQYVPHGSLGAQWVPLAPADGYAYRSCSASASPAPSSRTGSR